MADGYGHGSVADPTAAMSAASRRPDASPESRRRWRRCRSGAAPAVSGPPRPVLGVSGVVAGDERVEELGHRGPFGVVEESGGLEGETERLVVGEPGVVAEDEGVGGARQGDGQSAQRREGRLGSAGFVLAQLGHVDAGTLGQGDLGEAPGSAQAQRESRRRTRSETLPEVGTGWMLLCEVEPSVRTMTRRR